MNVHNLLHFSYPGIAESQSSDSRDQRNPHVVRAASLRQALFISHGPSSSSTTKPLLTRPAPQTLETNNLEMHWCGYVYIEKLVLMYSKDFNNG